jgi:tetratricopeptide (TPR) repeat protein
MIVMVVAGAVLPARAADAVVDAKRRAAAELFKEGKTTEAIAFLAEVVRADPNNYKDHLALARAYDKLNKSTEAASAYHRVLDLLASAQPDDRAARAEADRRLKVLEAQNLKVQAAEDEFLKKLEALEREALAAKDVHALRRIFRLKGGVYRAAERKDRAAIEVDMQRAWEGSGFTVTAGRSYRVRAVGTFEVRAGVESGPDGTAAVPENYQGPIGLLLARVGEHPELIKLGSSNRFVAAHSGPLLVMLNATMQEKAAANGSVTMLIEPE